MRPKVVLGIFLLAAGILALGLFLSKTSHPQPIAVAPAAPAPEPAPPTPAPVAVSAPAPVAAPAVVASADTNDVAEAKEKHAKYVKKRYDELMAMAMLNDYASHQPIIQDLTNSDVAIRKAALDAVQQTQDRALIPEIQQIADATEDPNYKQSLEDAIDFMKEPTLTEMIQQGKARQNAGISSSQSTPPANSPDDQGGQNPAPQQ